MMTVLLTWWSGLALERYAVTGSLIFADGFPGPATAWDFGGAAKEVTITADAVRVEATGGKGWATRDARLPTRTGEADPLLRVRVALTTERDDTGTGTGRSGGVMVWFRDSAEEGLDGTTLANLSGVTTDGGGWAAERVLAMPPGADVVVFAVLAREGDGAHTVRDVAIETVVTTEWYRVVAGAVALAWAALAVVLVRWLHAHASRPAFLAVAGLAGCVIVGILLPERFGQVISTQLDPLLPRAVSDLEPGVRAELMFKGGHLMLFAALAAIVFATVPRRQLPASQAATLLVLLALATEGVQLHLFDRTTRLVDLGADAAGILVGAILAESFLALSRRSAHRPT